MQFQVFYFLFYAEVLCPLLQDVIDGDLCEQFPSLPADMQRKIADELDRTPGEILKKLEDIRNKII
jgi:splicing factor 3B subunit 3